MRGTECNLRCCGALSILLQWQVRGRASWAPETTVRVCMGELQAWAGGNLCPSPALGFTEVLRMRGMDLAAPILRTSPAAVREPKDGFLTAGAGHQALPCHPTLATRAMLGLKQRMLRCFPAPWDTSCIHHWCTWQSGCCELTQLGMKTKTKSSSSRDNLCSCTTQNQAGCFFRHRKYGKFCLKYR